MTSKVCAGEWLAGRDLADNSTAAEEAVAISSGPLEVNVSTGTGRLLSLTSKAGLLSASLNSEVGCTGIQLHLRSVTAHLGNNAPSGRFPS